VRLRALGTVLCLAACLWSVGCLPRERLNSSCRWTPDSGALPPPGDPARRGHLIEDVRVAEELGIRYADSVAGGMVSDTYLRLRDRCTAASLDEIMRRHNVSREEIAAVTGARELWIDLLAVFLPTTALFLVVSRRVARHVVAGYDPEDRWVAVAVLAALTPLVAGAALAATQLWAWLVEMLRYRNCHISYRAARLPVSAAQYGWLLWGVAMGLFAGVAAAVLLRRGKVTYTGRRAIR
jgi:hypothetical protein